MKNKRPASFPATLRDPEAWAWARRQFLSHNGFEVPPLRRNDLSTTPRQGRERGSANEAAEILGVPVRTVRAHASRGELPGAGKIGGRWTFDLIKLRQYVRRREVESCQQSARPQRVPSGAAVFSGGGRRSVAGTLNGRYAQVIQRLRNGAARKT